MIELIRLSFTYPGATVPALRKISMQVPPGEALLLAGRSGSGKSTLLRSMNGLVPHFFGGTFQGKAIITGLDTKSASPMQLAHKVGTVFQEPGHRFLTDNLIDEIAFGMELVGISGRTIRSRVREIVDHFDLGSFETRTLSQLSAGEQQRVAVAAALSRRPELLLLDEPTSQLDASSTASLLDWLDDLRHQHGLTMVIAEHRLDRMIDRIDSLAFLSQTGRLKLLGTPQDLLDHLPFGTPIIDAARALGVASKVGAETENKIKDIIRRMPTPTMQPMGFGEERLQVKGISFDYNGLYALRDVDFSIRAGEIIALLGRNGAGKSTLIRCLMGLLPPKSGEIWLDGVRTDGKPVSELAKSMAYVPQWPSSLLFAENLLEELTFTLSNHGLEQDPPIQPRALLEQFGLADVMYRYPRDLSAGQRQRAALASVLVTKPKVLMLDEPTLGMDPVAKNDLAKLLIGWKCEGSSMLVATHDVEFAGAVADRIIILDQGEIAAQGVAAETLFSQDEYRTGLQRLTGCANPATVSQLKRSLNMRGSAHAND